MEEASEVLLGACGAGHQYFLRVHFPQPAAFRKRKPRMDTPLPAAGCFIKRDAVRQDFQERGAGLCLKNGLSVN